MIGSGLFQAAAFALLPIHQEEKENARFLSRFRGICRGGCHITKGDLPQILRNMVTEAPLGEL